MIESWVLWLVLVGLAVGVAVAWLLVVRLPRDEDDVGAAERQAEAEWIAAIIERHGGVAPRPFVEEVLELHQAYLREPRPPEPPAPAFRTAPPPADPRPAPGQSPAAIAPAGGVPPGPAGPARSLPRQVPRDPPGARPPTSR